MRKLALGLASAGAFVAITIGLAGPAMASPDYVVPGQDNVYSTHSHSHRSARRLLGARQLPWLRRGCELVLS
jgi:hypothetical protein